MTQSSYHEQIINIIKDYLGLNADQFVNRQIFLHLKKSPLELQQRDIPVLAIWIRSGMLVLTHDHKVVEEAFQRLTAITNK